MIGPWLAHALVLAFLVDFTVFQSVGASCVVRLKLDAQASKVVLTSRNELTSGNTPLSSPVTFDRDVPRGFTGFLYAVSQAFPACPNPADRAAWLANWSKFTLTSVPPSTTYKQPVSVYPVLNLGQTIIAGLDAETPKYDYNVSTLGATFTIRDLAAASGQSGSYTGGVSTELVDGWLSSYSFITKTRVDNLQNLTADASGVAVSFHVKEVSGSIMLVLDVPSLELTYQAVGNLNISGVAWKSIANVTLTASLRATAILDCPSYCGDYGRCEIVNGTANCVCDCGWSKDSSQQCNLPWGYCDASGGVISADSSTCLANTTAVSVSPSNGTCPVGYDWDATGTNCNACPSGFTGRGCLMCTSDTACRTRLSSSTAQCSMSPAYQPRTASKQYTCNVLNPAVAVFVGTVINFNCSTTKPGWGVSSISDMAIGSGLAYGNSPVNSTPYCQLSFRSSDMPLDAVVVCTGWDCKFAVGSTKVHCPVVKCACPRGCSSAIVSETTFTTLESGVKLACGAEASKSSEMAADGTSSCSIELNGLPIPAIPISCKATECLDPVNGSVFVSTGDLESRAHLAVAPVVSWVPSMVLLLAATATVAAMASYGHWVCPGPVGHDSNDDAASAGPARPLGEGIEEPPAAPGLGGEQTGGSSGSGGGGGKVLAVGGDPPAVVAHVADSPLGEQCTLLPASGQPLLSCPPPRPASRQPLPGQLRTLPGGETPRQEDMAARGSRGTERSHSEVASSAEDGIGRGIGVMAARHQQAAGTGAGALLPTGPPPAAKLNAAESGATKQGSDRPMVQVLSWHGLQLRTRPRRAALRPWHVQPAATLLRNVSGKAVSGEILGVMGPSGSGKTTLLSVLAGLIQPGLHWDLDGTVRLDGRTVVEPRHLAALVGHVPQHDLLCRSLTVAECVATSAALRLSFGELRRGRGHVQARVESVLRKLGISYLAHRMAWPGGGASLSGGERLRVSVSMELVSDPPLLLLDEPLSGLDSATARSTMAVLRDVATDSRAVTGGGGMGPRVVIISLHQPSPALFGALDFVMVMAGGQVAAAGPPGSMSAVLMSAGLPLPPPDVHIAEHLLDLVFDPAQAAQLCNWHTANGVEQPSSPPPAVAAAFDDGDTKYVRSLVHGRGGGSGASVRLRRFWLELGVVAWRSGLDMLRNPSLLALHLVVTGALGLLVGGVFSDTNLNVSGAQNRVGAIFFAVMLLACFATSAVDGLYPERATVDRDLLRRSYGVVPYVIVKLVLDGVLLRALPAWAFGVPFYWLMGLRVQAAAFFTFIGAFTTMSCLSGAACIALSCVFSSPGRTVLVLNLLLLICALFSGFLANKDTIVAWLRWIVYLSPIRFCWEALVINELKPLVLSFSAPDLPQGLPAVKGSLFLSLLGVDSDLLNTDLIVLGCMYAIISMLAISFAALRLAALRGRCR